MSKQFNPIGNNLENQNNPIKLAGKCFAVGTRMHKADGRLQMRMGHRRHS